MKYWLLTFLFFLLAVPAHAKPSRIVSVNLCIDQLVLELAEKDNIAAVSFNSHNPSMSLNYIQAREHQAVRASAEDILQLKPDLVFTGPGGHGLKELLTRHGIVVRELGMAMTFEDIRTQVAQLGEWLGEQKRAARLLSQMEKQLRASHALYEKDEVRPRVGVYYLNGYSDGTGTLMDETITLAGGSNMASERGMNGMGYLPMEVLVNDAPSLLVVNAYESDYPALGQQVLSHPAVVKSLGDHTLAVNGRRLACATPDYANVVYEIAHRLHEK